MSKTKATQNEVEAFVINGIEIPKFNPKKIQFYTVEQIEACGGLEKFAELVRSPKSISFEKIDFSNEEFEAMLEHLKKIK